MSTREDQSVTDATVEVVCTLDRTGCVTHLDPAGEGLTGLTRSEALGRDFHELLQPTDADGAPLPAQSDPVRATLRDGEPRAIVHGVCPNDGSHLAVTGTCTPMVGADGACTGAVVRFGHANVSADERRYRSLVAATSDFVWHSAPDGTLHWIGDAWLDLVGLTADAAAGWGWLEAIHPEDRATYEARWRQAVAGGTPFEHEYRLCCADGSTRWFVDRAVPVRDDTGAIVEWVGAGRDISERREAEEERRRQRERYRTLVESTSAILWEGDPDTFRFTYISPEAETLLGYAPERWMRESDFWVSHMHPDDRGWAPAFCARATRELRQHSFDYRMIAADGRTVWLRDVVSVLADEDGPSKLVGVMVDITSTKEAEAQLEYVSGLQRILVEAAGALVAAGPGGIDTALTEALGRVGAYCHVDRSYVIRFDDRHATMTMTHEWHADGVDPLMGRLVDRPHAAVPALTQKMLRREVLHIPRMGDLGPDWDTDRRALEAQGLQSVMIVPIVADDAVHGYVGFDSVRAETEWRDTEVRLLRGLADVIGATLQRDRADRERRASEARFRAIADHLPGVVYERVMHPDGRVRLTYLSPGLEQLMGVDPDAAMADPRRIIGAIPVGDRAAYRAALERSAAELTPLDHRHRFVTPSGAVRWGRLLGQPQRHADSTITWHGLTIDETERIEAETRLQESRALQEIAGRAAHVGGWVVDLEHDRIRWSDEVYAIHDLEPGETLTLEQRLAFYTPASRDRIREAFRTCAQEGIAYDEEVDIVTATGRHAWVRTIGQPVRDGSGEITYVRGALQDITEQKQAREEVQRLADRLTSTLESITDAFFTVDPDWCITYVNRQAERLMNIDRDAVLGHDLWSRYPDLLGTVVEREYRRALDEQVATEFEFYYPARSAWFEIRAYPSEEGLGVYFRDITERKRAREEIEFLALYDPLTQLPNRRLLLDRLGHALAATGRTGQRCAVLFLDLDNFKTLNDTLGHDVGDRMLQQAAGRLHATVRASDTVARFGGDEFAIVLERLSSERDGAIAEARQVGEKIRTALAEPYQLHEHERRTTVSVGITLFGEDTDDSADDVMKRADLAMYQAKEAGRGTVRVFDPSMRAAVQSRVALEDALRKALDRGEVVPWFQPQFDDRGRMVGAEALARWLAADGEPVSPAEFIPVAEETGLILPLGDTVLEAACTRLAAWASGVGPGPIDVSVNVSARQFHHPDFVEQVRAIVARTGVPVEHLWLELTESLLLVDIDDTIRKMTALRSEGVRFTLDDFGTGYSSLAYLKRLPLDQVKIDQGFVRDALDDPNDAAIVRTIIVLAATMGLEVVAEGVETEAVRRLLAAEGCRIYQGFLYSPAVPPAELEALGRASRGAADGPADA